jgi:Zn-dependent protease with chaperone function
VGEIIEKRWMAPTQIPETRMQRLSTRVKEMVDAQYPDLVWNLAFRNMRNVEDAFNAFALPGGTIVLLDGLTEVLSDNQVIAIVGLLAMASVVLGDVSSLAAGVTAGYQDLHYSRDNEREADLFAIEFMRRGNVPVRHMVAAFEAIRQREASGDLPGFLSSHPPTDERMRFAQEAASP